MPIAIFLRDCSRKGSIDGKNTALAIETVQDGEKNMVLNNSLRGAGASKTICSALNLTFTSVWVALVMVAVCVVWDE